MRERGASRGEQSPQPRSFQQGLVGEKRGFNAPISKMGARLRDVVHALDYDELVRMKRDIDKGSVHLSKLISEKIKDIEKQHENNCSVCTAKINPESINNYTLIFGPDDFRKKATFCAIDCLEYFISNLKNQKKEVIIDGKTEESRGLSSPEEFFRS